MKQYNVIDKFVTLKSEFLDTSYKKIDRRVPLKSQRPYLVVDAKYRNGNRLFALPMYSNICDTMPEQFNEIMPPRLETSAYHHCGLMYPTMLPINMDCVDATRYSDQRVPESMDRREDAMYNIAHKNNDAIPEKGIEYLWELQQLLVKKGIMAFECGEFISNYKQLQKIIFEDIRDFKDENIEQINEHAKEYLDFYRSKLASNFYMRHEYDYPTPQYFTRIDNLIPFGESFGQKKKPNKKLQHLKEVHKSKKHKRPMDDWTRHK